MTVTYFSFTLLIPAPTHTMRLFPPLSDPKPAKSHTQIKKRLRITDFVLNQPSSPSAVSPNPTFPLPLSPSPVIPSVHKTNHNDLPGPSQHLPHDDVQPHPKPELPSSSPLQNHNQLPTTEQFSTTVTTGGFTTSTPLQECGFFPSFTLPGKVVPSRISIPQEKKPPGQPSKSARSIEVNRKPAPTTCKLDSKPINPPHSGRENEPPPCKSAPPTGHPKSAPTAKCANSKAVNPPKRTKGSKLTECNSPHPGQENSLPLASQLLPLAFLPR